MSGHRTRHDELQEEVDEIFQVLKRERPEASTFELWTEALDLHQLRYDHDVLALDEEGNVVNLGRMETVYGPD